MHRLPPLHTVNTILIGLHSTWVILYIAAIVLVSVDSKYKQEDADFLVEQCIAYVKFGVYIVLFSLIILVKYIYVSRIYLTLATVYLLDAVVSLCIILVYFGRFDNNSYQNNGKYRDEYVLFVAITNGLVILLDLVMLPVLRCFHRQDEYRKNIGLPPLSTIKRSRVYQVDDATLSKCFYTCLHLRERLKKNSNQVKYYCLRFHTFIQRNLCSKISVFIIRKKYNKKNCCFLTMSDILVEFQCGIYPLPASVIIKMKGVVSTVTNGDLSKRDPRHL